MPNQYLEWSKNIYDRVISGSDISHIIDSDEIEYTPNDEISKELAVIQSYGLTAYIVNDNRLRFKNRHKDVNLYFNDEDFYNRCVKSQEFIKNILIFNFYTSTPNFFDGQNKESYQNFVIDNSAAPFEISIYYHRFLDLLKENGKNEATTPAFVEYFNQISYTAIFTSPTRGRLDISFRRSVPFEYLGAEVVTSIEQFIECINGTDANMSSFIKQELFVTLQSVRKLERSKVLIDNLDTILQKAKVNFDIYLSNLSIDRIKSDYYELKHKYFEELSSVLSSITTKIISLPIAISATLFAVIKSADVTFALVTILVSIIVATGYMTVLLKLNLIDVNDISRSTDIQYEALKESTFFVKHPNQITDFHQIKSQLKERVKTLRLMIHTYYWVIILANISLVCFILDLLGSPGYIVFISACVSLMLAALARNYLFYNNIAFEAPEK